VEKQLPDMMMGSGGVDQMIEYHISSLIEGLRPHHPG
jgi:hypothetical protein